MAADTANNEKIVRQTLEAFEAANERGIREGLARDFVFHNAPPGFTENADGFVQLARHVKSGIPDAKLTIHDIFSGGDKVAVRFSHGGTHRGELIGVPPSNRTVTIRGIEIYRLSDGKIAEYWGELDASDVFGPPPGIGNAGAEGQRQL
jgi:predicted ester cyclase